LDRRQYISVDALGAICSEFYFHGYLAKESEDRRKDIIHLQKSASTEKVTHLFIETPYRNDQMLASLLEVLHDDIWLCVGLGTDYTSTRGVIAACENLEEEPAANLAKKNASSSFRQCKSLKKS